MGRFRWIKLCGQFF